MNLEPDEPDTLSDKLAWAFFCFAGFALMTAAMSVVGAVAFPEGVQGNKTRWDIEHELNEADGYIGPVATPPKIPEPDLHEGQLINRIHGVHFVNGHPIIGETINPLTKQE